MHDTFFPLVTGLLLQEAVDWSVLEDEDADDEFIEFTRHHGVTALVAYYLRDVDESSETVQQLKQQLHDTALQEAAFELFRTNQLQLVLAACKEQGVQPLVIKGAALAQTHYPSPELRARCDADIFIDMGDIGRIQVVMKSLGYTVSGSIYKSHQFSCSLQAAKSLSMTFDVHWRVSNSPLFARSLSYQEALDQSIEIDADGIRGLSPDHALLLACMHRAGSAKHDPDRLIWLYDLHLLVSGMGPGEQSAFARLALDTGVQDVCLEGIARSSKYFNTELSQEAMSLLSENSYSVAGTASLKNSYPGLVLDDLRYLKSWHDRVGLLRELLLPSSSELLMKYQKKSLVWVPWLYVRYLVGGIFRWKVKQSFQ